MAKGKNKEVNKKATNENQNNHINTNQTKEVMEQKGNNEVAELKQRIAELELEKAEIQREVEARMLSVDQACIVSEVDLKGFITYVNDKHCEVSQYTREELMGQNQNIVRHPDMPKEVFKEMWATIGRGKIFRGKVKNRRKDGTPYYVDGIFTPVLGDNGKPVKYIGIRFDITETTIEQQRMKGIMDAIDASFAFIEFDIKGNIITANENFQKGLGYSLSEMKGRHHRMFVDTAYANTQDYVRFWEELSAGKAQSGQFRRIKKDGTDLWIQAVYSPVKDEMGRITGVIKIATDITEQKVVTLEIGELAGKMAQGDLTAKFVMQTADKDLQMMGDALNAAIENMNATLANIVESAALVADSSVSLESQADAMAATTTEVASAISQMSKGAQDQAAKTDESSRMIEQVMRSANDMSDKANVINKAAEEGKTKCTDGLKIMTTLIANMGDIEGSAGLTANSIKVLTERAEEIGRTLNVITDIAAQTNLLALNAAIEAARAGEAGRGFAVVAEEIRKLAEDSKNAAVNINMIINNVTKDTQAAGKAIDQMTGAVKSGNAASKSAEDIFQQINIQSDQTLNYSKEIQDASTDQKKTIDNVVKNIEQIVVVAEETAAGTEEVATSSNELNNAMIDVKNASNSLSQIAAELQAGVSQFRLADITAMTAPNRGGVPARGNRR